MPIAVSCQCGKKFAAPEKLAGKSVKCPGCTQPIAIPELAGGVAKPATQSAGNITVSCRCGKKFAAPPILAGKKVKCPACSAPLAIPGGTKPKQVAGALDDGGGQTIDAAPDLMGELLDEIGLEAAAAGNLLCPNCKAQMSAEAVLCVSCGFNVESGKQLRTESFVKATANDSALGPPTGHGKGKKNKHR